MTNLQAADTIKIEGKEYIIVSTYQHPQSDNVLLTLQLPKGTKQYVSTVYPGGLCSTPTRLGF